jgi:hypothetical protein
MVIKTEISTITAIVATIAAIASMGSIGGIGLGQQQMALAQVDPGEIGEDEADLGDIGIAVRDIFEEDDEEEDDGRQRLCPGQIFIRPNICVDALPNLSDTVGIPNVGSDDDDPNPEVPLCRGPGEIFIPRPLGPICINTNIDASPTPG